MSNKLFCADCIPIKVNNYSRELLEIIINLDIPYKLFNKIQIKFYYFTIDLLSE